jgi:catechol 2,3-dioxygenase-like lactoylglutathione lyase family enzyme
MEMKSKEKVVARQMHQVCVVVRDLQAAVERYWNLFGIGPWQFYTFRAPELTDPVIHGKPQPYSMRIALAYMGDVQWELIQPLSGPSIYQEFLDDHGEGVHHVALGVDDYDDTIAAMRKQGVDVLMSGCWNGTGFSYLDTEKNLGVIVELFKYAPEFVMPEPEATYPPQD